MEYPEIKKVEETKTILSFVVSVKESDGSIKPYMFGVDDSEMSPRAQVYPMNDMNHPMDLHYCWTPNEYQIRRYMNPNDMGRTVQMHQNGEILWETAKMVKFVFNTVVETTMRVVE